VTNPVCGDCFRWAGKAIIQEPEHVRLVHGTVSPPWLGKHRFAHAWIETSKRVYDWQTMVPEAEPARSIWPAKYRKYAGKGWPRKTFYRVFEPKGVTRYTGTEAVRAMVTNRHWGPWQ